MAKRSRKATKATRAARPRRSRRAAGDNLAGTKLDGKSVREMTETFNKLVPEAEKRGLKFWWLKEHISPFESRAAAVRMIDKLEAAMEAVLASRRKRVD
jgi:hypothetical protein